MEVSLQAYLKGSAEAVEFYKKAFDAELGYNVKSTDNTYMHAEIKKGEQHIISLSEFDDFQSQSISGNTMQFCINFGTEKSVKKAYEILIEGGKINIPLGPCPWNTCIADVTDKFGVRWYIAI